MNRKNTSGVRVEGGCSDVRNSRNPKSISPYFFASKILKIFFRIKLSDKVILWSWAKYCKMNWKIKVTSKINPIEMPFYLKQGIKLNLNVQYFILILNDKIIEKK